jgi:hypothetical protein
MSRDLASEDLEVMLLREIDSNIKVLNEDIVVLNSNLAVNIWWAYLSLVMLFALIVVNVYEMRLKYLRHKQYLAEGRGRELGP